MDDKLLTPEEAGKKLGILPGTLARWRSKGIGPEYIKLNNRLIRYWGSALFKYINEWVILTHPERKK